jgi:predicted MFS family arabinose efflux permease
MRLRQRVRALRAGPLAARHFVLLVSGRTISMFGSAMAPIALAFAVLDLTHSPRDLGIVLAARGVSVIAFLLLGGVVADRLPRNLVMVGSSVLAGASQAAAAALLLSGSAHVAPLAALQVVNGACSAFTLPATSAVLPQTVPADLLRQANALARMGSNAATIGGAALGGVVVAHFGAGWGIAVDAASFFLAAALFAGVRVARVSSGDGTGMFRELADGWRDFRARTWVWVIVSQFAFINMVWGGAFNVLGPVVAEKRLGGAAAWGIIIAAEGAGLILGGFLSAWRHDKRPLLAGNNALFLQLPMLALLAAAAPLALVAAAAVLGGVGIEIFEVRWSTTMQEQVPADLQSRLFSYDALGSFLFVPVGQVLAAPVQAVLGTGGAIWAGTAVVGCAVVAVAFVPQVRAVRAHQPPEPTAGQSVPT